MYQRLLSQGGESMKTEQFIAKAESLLREAFPAYFVKLVADPDDAATIFAYTFNVPDGTEKTVTDQMYDVIEEKLDGNGWDVIPSVTSLTTTKEYYPEYFRSNPPEPEITNERVLDVVDDLDADIDRLLASLAEAFDWEAPKPCGCDQIPSDVKTHESQTRFAA